MTIRPTEKALRTRPRKTPTPLGKQETLYAAYTPGEKDYSSLIGSLKDAGIEVIYIGGYHTEIGLIARQAKDQGLKVQIIAPRLAFRPTSSGRSPATPARA